MTTSSSEQQSGARAQWRRMVWMVAAILGVVGAVLVWSAQQRERDARAFHQRLVRDSVQGATREILLHLANLRTSVSLFAEKERRLLRRLADAPDDVEIYETLLKRIKEYFSDGFAVTLADQRGEALVVDADGFVNQMCLADLREFGQQAFTPPEVYIHPNPLGYHIDIMVGLNLGGAESHAFFISFYPDKIAEILKRYQVFGDVLYLINRDADGLIELDEHGSRDAMRRDYFLTEAERAAIAFSMPVDGTQWALVDLPQTGGFAGARGVWLETSTAMLALLLLAAYLLYAQRRDALRIDHQGRALQAQADELRARSEQLTGILERTTDAYLEFDPDWRCTFANPQAGRLLGVSPDELVNHTLWDALPELASGSYKKMQKARAENLPHVFESHYPPNQRWLETHVYPSPCKTTVFMRDVTQERSAWEQVKNAEVRVRVILENVADAIITIDDHGVIETFNAAAQRMFGHAADDVIGMKVNVLMPEPHRSEHDRYLTRYRRTHKANIIGVTRELPALRRDGTLFPLEINVTHVIHGERDFFIGVLRDMTQRHETEQRMRALARFPDEDPSPVLRVGADGAITYANRPAEFLLRAWDTPVAGVVPSAIRTMVVAALEAAAPIERELRCFERVYSAVLTPVSDGNYVNLYARDITDRKRMEDELKAHRDHLEELVNERTAALAMAHNEAITANRAKSAFLASMSHELRTPLNAIIGYSEMLEEQASDEGRADVGADVKKIKIAGKHLLALINDILDLSKVEAGKLQLLPELFSVQHVLRDIETTIRPMVAKNGNRFLLAGDGELGEMYSDPTRLKQVLLNLLGNACKFTSHGSITLWVRREFITGKDWLVFVVTDTGIGMTAQQLGRLFQPFSQADTTIATKFGGTGLGLAISQRLCQVMGGEIKVKSAPGTGSIFTVRLPAQAVEQ